MRDPKDIASYTKYINDAADTFRIKSANFINILKIAQDSNYMKSTCSKRDGTMDTESFIIRVFDDSHDLFQQKHDEVVQSCVDALECYGDMIKDFSRNMWDSVVFENMHEASGTISSLLVTWDDYNSVVAMFNDCVTRPIDLTPRVATQSEDNPA